MMDEQESEPTQSEDAGALMTQVSVDKRAEFFRDVMKTVLGLSTGAIVFSVTFLHDVVHVAENSTAVPSVSPQHTQLLIGAWLVLLVSVVASLVFLIAHALSTKYEAAFSGLMTVTAVAGNLGLVAGLCLLAYFAAKNLPS